MPFELTPAVRVRRNAAGQITHLSHMQQPYTLGAAGLGVMQAMAGTSSLRHLSDQYVRDVLPHYELAQSLATGLTSVTAAAPTNDGQQLRFASEKSLAGNATVSYVQTFRGIPVWHAGFSVQLLENSQQVVGSQSTVSANVAPHTPAASAAFLPARLTSETLAGLLGITGTGALPRINQARLFVYRYQAEQRILPTPQDPTQGFVTNRSVLPLPPVAPDIADGKDYFVAEVYFTWAFPNAGELNWQALIEVETGSVLYLRPLVGCLSTGMVFLADPVTRSGDPANNPGASAAVLNGFREIVNLQGLLSPLASQAQELTGKYVTVIDLSPPPARPPTALAPAQFHYAVNSDDFSAVNAYHHCDRLFRLVEELGLNLATYFNGTQFPVRVDHRATIGSASNTVNAEAPGNAVGNGSDGFRFALAQVNTSVGIADDWRVVLHEFGHALLWDHVHSPNFGFSHSAGDSLAAILNDPGNQADRSATFPWIQQIHRRHDRTAAAGWAWYGPQYEPFSPGGNDQAGYIAEQMLSSTMFRIYQSAGGDSNDQATQRFAAHYVVFLILKAIGLLSPTTNANSPEDFADVLIQADTGTFLHDGQAQLCGVLHKVVRWSFEKQGAYQPAGTAPQSVAGPGDPPDVDVFIDDGRNGEYPYLASLTNAPGIWVRNAADNGTTHQTPLKNTTNSVYVRIINQGTKSAQNVRVRAYRSTVLNGAVWPTDWQSLTGAPLLLTNPLPPDADDIAGPFPWTPTAAQEILMAFAEADGDTCNTQRFSAQKPIITDRIAAGDNNMALRIVVVL